MAFGKGKASAAETKARELRLALARLAEDVGTPAQIGVDRVRQASPRFTPLALGQMVRREHDAIEAVLSERGLTLIDYRDKGPGRGMEFTIDAAREPRWDPGNVLPFAVPTPAAASPAGPPEAASPTVRGWYEGPLNLLPEKDSRPGFRRDEWPTVREAALACLERHGELI